MANRISSLPRSAPEHRDARGQAVLSAIIKEHLVTGEAVGSHAISDRFEHAAGWGAATIRYVMSELEEAGLLEQPHTSAGRIPTDQGYRYYVDHILGSARISRGDRKAIESIGQIEASARPDRLMERASHVLSALSENVGIVVWPPLAENRLEHIKFLRLPDSRILVVLVTASNIVQDKVIRLDENFSQDELDRTARYLNAEFGGKSLLAIRAEIIELMREEKALYDRLLRNAMLLCEGSLVGEETIAGEVYVDGASNILTKPEFAGGETMRELFRTFEEKSRLVAILNECVARDFGPGDVKVVIGCENVTPSMKGCAVITASYRVGDDISGTVGVVGPTRIEYARMMGVVNYLARFIERALSHEASFH